MRIAVDVSDWLAKRGHFVAHGQQIALETIGQAIRLGKRLRIASRSASSVTRVKSWIRLRDDHDRSRPTRGGLGEGLMEPGDVRCVTSGPFISIGIGVAKVVARTLNVQGH